jgi:hypothetical protein
LIALLSRAARPSEGHMLDLLVLTLALACFALFARYLIACERG